MVSGPSATSFVSTAPRLCGFHQRDEGDQRSNLSPCLLSASDPEFAYARGFYVWSPDSGVLPVFRLIRYIEYISCSLGRPASIQQVPFGTCRVSNGTLVSFVHDGTFPRSYVSPRCGYICYLA